MRICHYDISSFCFIQTGVLLAKLIQKNDRTFSNPVVTNYLNIQIIRQSLPIHKDRLHHHTV